jgi:endonuclease YncB( thermonuclease family)
VSKHFKPGAKSVAVRPSRIRREPVRVKTEAELQKEAADAREREKWRATGGVLFFAAGIAALAVAISVVTYSRYDPKAAAAEAVRFRQCYNAAAGTNCVLDGDTIRVGQQWMDIAGIEAPQIKGAACEDQKIRGIDAAVRLADLLNSGTVIVGEPSRDPYGRAVRKVEVDGRDVGKAMISAGAARIAIADKRDWCAQSAEYSQDSD